MHLSLKENLMTKESPVPRPYRILVADDHAVVRRGVRALLESQPGLEVCCEAATGLEAVEHVKKKQTKSRPARSHHARNEWPRSRPRHSRRIARDSRPHSHH